MMNRWVCRLLVAAAVAAMPSPAAASWHVAVSAATDYIFRGFSRSDSDGALQAGLRYRHSEGFSAGLWASTVGFPTDEGSANERRIEVQGFAGYAAPLTKDWLLSAFLLRYEYPGAGADVDTSYSEAEVSFVYRGMLQATLAYTPDFLASSFPGHFAEVAGRYPLPGLVDLSAGLGRAELDTPMPTSYTYGHLGVGWSREGLDLELGYYLTDARAIPRWGEVADGSWVLSLSARFPRKG